MPFAISIPGVGWDDSAELRGHQRLARLDVLASAPAQITRDRDIYRIRNPVLFQLVITVPPGLHRPEDLTRTRHLDSQDRGGLESVAAR
jgi:hypothetical protein